MLIDFRVRPPYKTNLTTSLYNKPAPSPDPTKQSIFLIGKERVPSAEARSIELFMQEMDETETERAVIMGRKADEYGSVDNDEIDELARAYPGRFIPFAGFNPNLPGQVEEIERVAAMGFRGVGIDAGWLRRPLYHDDPVFDPIYAKCQELGMIVSLTSSFMLGPDLSYSEPCAIQRVAMKYPNMKIVVPHGCWPHVHTALAVAIRCPNVYLMPDCYIYIDGFALSDEYIKAANTYLKYRILYASSYPVRSLSQCLRGWKSRGFTDEALQNTLYDNAARLLGEKIRHKKTVNRFKTP